MDDWRNEEREKTLAIYKRGGIGSAREVPLDPGPTPAQQLAANTLAMQSTQESAYKNPMAQAYLRAKAEKAALADIRRTDAIRAARGERHMAAAAPAAPYVPTEADLAAARERIAEQLTARTRSPWHVANGRVEPGAAPGTSRQQLAVYLSRVTGEPYHVGPDGRVIRD